MPPVENTRTAKVWTALRRMVSMSSAATDGEFHVWPSSVNSEAQPLPLYLRQMSAGSCPRLSKILRALRQTLGGPLTCRM